MNLSLTEIFAGHQGKVCDKWEQYLIRYEKLFATRRSSALTLLEIGVQNGGSLEIWAAYFAQATHIIGAEIDPRSGDLRFDDPRIRVVVTDATKPEAIDAIGVNSYPLDVIIDDGSHLSGDVIRTFVLFFPRLAEEGIYVVEDVHASYYAEFDATLFEPTSMMSFFERLADVVNHEHWDGYVTPKDAIHSLLALRDIEVSDLDWIDTIHAITFSNSMITIEKASRVKNQLGRQLVTGTHEPVLPGRLALNRVHYERSRMTERGSSSRYPTMPPEAVLASAQAGLSAAEQTIQQYKAAIVEQGDALLQVTEDRDRLNAEVRMIHNSTSWRITGLLRLIGGQSRRLRSIARRIQMAIRSRGGVANFSYHAYKILAKEGPHAIISRLRYDAAHSNSSGQRVAQPEDYTLDLAAVAGGPLLSVIVPVYNTPLNFLRECIDSVRDQIYQNWELILVDDHSSNAQVRRIMRERASRDSRIKCIFRQENGHISAALNTGLAAAEGEYFAVLDHDDVLDPSALYRVAEMIIKHPDADYLYSDEDKLSEDGRHCFGPFHKPDWSPEYMLSMMYTCHLSVFRRAWAQAVGGYRSEYDGTQDYDFALRVVAKTDNVYHIPRVLYHWRMWSNSTASSLEAKPYAFERQRQALADYLHSMDESFEIQEGPVPGHHKVGFLPRGRPLVSIVVPTANGSILVRGQHRNHLDEVVKSILEKSTYDNYEIVVVHNNNLNSSQLDWLGALQQVRLVAYEDQEFSLARKINKGCAAAEGEYLLILNDDVRVITPGWIEQMLGMAQRKGVGVVGAKLLFPNDTVQHAGVLVLGGLPGHAYYEQPDTAAGYALGALVNRNYLAVTGACQMTPKALFEQLGGYSERYPLNYNDVDYCLKLHQRGYRAVYMADVKLYHYEGVSKDGGRSVAADELQKFLEDWRHTYPLDPFYNPNLNQHYPYGA